MVGRNEIVSPALQPPGQSRSPLGRADVADRQRRAELDISVSSQQKLGGVALPRRVRPLIPCLMSSDS